MRPLALLLVLLSSLAAAADTFRFGPEQPLGSMDTVPAFGTQRDARVATSGDGALAVWNDGRDPNHIFGTRLDRDGRVLDSAGIDIAEGYEADVVWTGSEYVVGMTYGCGAVQLLRVTTASEVAPLAPVFATGTSCGDRIAMAVAGERVIAVIRSNGNVRYGIVSLGARAVVASQEIPFAGSVVDIDVTTDGRDFLIAGLAVSSSGLVTPETVRVSTDGAVLSRRQLGTFAGYREIAVTWTGSAYLVAWSRTGILGQLVTSDNAIQGERLALVAEFVPTAAPVLAPYAGGAILSYSNVTATGEVLAKTLARIVGTTVTQTDQFLVTAGGGDSMPADVAGDFYVWSEKGDVFGAKLENGARRDPKILTFSTRMQRLPAVASNSGVTLAAWIEDGSLVAQLGGTPVNLGGSDFNVPPVVVFDGSSFNVFWSFGQKLLLRRIARDGTVIDAEPVVVMERILANERFAAGAGGGRVLVVRTAVQEPEHDLVAAIVTNGVVGPPFFIAGPQPFDHLPSIAWNGTDFFVAWVSELPPVILPVPPPPSLFEVVVARVSPEGVMREPGAITIAPLRPFAREVAAASIGGEVVVFWTDAETRTLRATRLSASGAIIDADRLLATEVVGRPVAIAEGSVYSVAWIANGKNFVMQRFSPALQAVTAPTVIASANRTLSWIALAPGVAAYQRLAEEPRFGFVPRAFVRFLDAGGGRRRPTSPR
ncbi:MAG TPA: hypothetical protein VJ276_21210 [Thermoanaerobaculia bacterium]|nr:hypothetical protein [Thermoanaerobaculia bacterium]